MPPLEPLDFIRWLFSYRHLTDPFKETIWWSVLKNYYEMLLAVIMTVETILLAGYHFLLKWLTW